MLCMSKKNENIGSGHQANVRTNHRKSAVLNATNKSLKIMMIAACTLPLLSLLYFYLLGWNLYHDKPLSVVYGLVMGIGFLVALGVCAILFYTYKVQRRATKRAVRFDSVLLASWMLLIATFFSYLSSAVYKAGFSDIVTLALVVMVAPLATIVLPKTSKVSSLVFGVVALLVVTLEMTMATMANTAGDGVWTVALPSWLGLAANIFAAVVLLSRLRRK